MIAKIKTNAIHGVNFYENEENNLSGRTSESINMIRSTPGKIRKRLGFYEYKIYPNKINSMIFSYSTIVVHAGTNLYIGTNLVYSTLRNAKSCMFSVNEKIYLLDGMYYYLIDVEKNTVRKVGEIAYIPTVKIGKNADGSGGVTYEDRNVLTGKWNEQFCTDGSKKIFQLCYSNLTSTIVNAKVKGADGVSFTNLKETIDFTVDRTKGLITFISAPQKSFITGEDNVIISAEINLSPMKNYINMCTIGFVFGDSSKGLRVFATGNRAYNNYDYYSQANDPTYFSEYSYGILGDSENCISGYASCGDKIAAFKSGKERKIYIRKPFYKEYNIDGEIKSSIFGFAMCDEIISGGQCYKGGFGFGDGENLYLTDKGVFALTRNSMSDNVSSYLRSYFANGKLLKEKDLINAVCVNYNDFYFVFTGEYAYAFDLLAKAKLDEKPQSKWQYECFYLDGLNVKTAVVNEDKLYFTGDNGVIYCFNKDEKNHQSYLDNGSSIKCKYQSGFVFFGKNEKIKKINGFYITFGKSPKNEIYAEYYYNGRWKKFERYKKSPGYDSFENPLNSKEIFLPIKIERDGKTAIRILNDGPASPLFIDGFAVNAVL